MKLEAVDWKTLAPEVFRVFEAQPPLLTAGDRSGCNTMTVGWCQLGTLWGRPVCTVYVRPERYTYEFMEKHNHFTLSVLPADAKKITALCGARSGREVDKIRECGLTVRYGAEDAPFFEEAELALVCQKLYVQDLSAGCVREESAILPYYGEKGGWHRAYIGEVVEAYASRA